MDSPAPKSVHENGEIDTNANKPFSVSINLGKISPEKVMVKIEDRKMTLSGEHVEKLEDENGIIRFNFHGFCKDFDLPPGVEFDSLTFTILDNQTMKIEVDDEQTKNGIIFTDTVSATPQFTVNRATTVRSLPLQNLSTKSLHPSNRIPGPGYKRPRQSRSPRVFETETDSQI